MRIFPLIVYSENMDTRTPTRHLKAVFMKILCLVLLIVVSQEGICQSELRGKIRQYQKVLRKDVTGEYYIFLPKDYGMTTKRYPLIMYLHGGSLRGAEFKKISTMGLPHYAETHPDFPFVVLAPQCPAGEIWTNTDMLRGLLDEISSRYRVDRERIYLTGHSMGGRGTWYFAYTDPDRFAAIAPMSAVSTIAAWADKLTKIPIWTFHGENDTIARVEETAELVKAIKADGGDIKFSLLPGRDHFILDIYENEELYRWFLEHRRSVNDHRTH